MLHLSFVYFVASSFWPGINPGFLLCLLLFLSFLAWNESMCNWGCTKAYMIFTASWYWNSIFCPWRHLCIPLFTLKIILTFLFVQAPGFVELKQIPCFFFEEIRFHGSWSSWANSEFIDIVFIRFAMNIRISSLQSVPNLKVSKIQNIHFFCWKYLFNKNRLKPYKPYIEKNLARKGVTVPIYLLLFNRLHFEGFNIKEFIINHVFNHVSW